MTGLQNVPKFVIAIKYFTRMIFFSNAKTHEHIYYNVNVRYSNRTQYLIESIFKLLITKNK